LSEERAYWLAWSQMPGVGCVLLKRIAQHFDSLAAAWKASQSALAEVEGLGSKSVGAIAQARSQLDPQEFLDQHLQKNPHFWTPADPDYPRLLLEIPSPPSVLYYRGKVELLENQGITPAIGIVGTRSPTLHGRRWTQKIATRLAQSGFSVVSGMAKGIDGEAHRACLEARGRTIAVLGTGVDVVYPFSHRHLYEQIQQQGLILSEYPAQTQPNKSNFPARNRIIAGLCRAVLVMEAPDRSGALITAQYANEFNRDIYSLPNSPDVREAMGCLRLIHRGAEIILKEDELLEALGAIPNLDGKNGKKPEDFLKVLKAIAPQPTSFDAIAIKTALPTNKVLAILSQLEMQDLIAEMPGKHYQRIV
jgi:DNA processing protein